MRMDRRWFLVSAATALATGTLLPRRALATRADVAREVESLTGGAQLKSGKIRLDLPAVAEYGDTVPLTPAGKMLAVFIMVLGYSLIIVPTGILSSELIRMGDFNTRTCQSCSREGHDADAKHCKHCGEALKS